MSASNAAKAAPALAGSDPQDCDRLAGAISSVVKPTPSRTQEVPDGIDRAEDLLALWRWCRSLAHRLHILRLRYEHDVLGLLDGAEHDHLAYELEAFNRLCRALAEGRAR